MNHNGEINRNINDKSVQIDKLLRKNWFIFVMKCVMRGILIMPQYFIYESLLILRTVQLKILNNIYLFRIVLSTRR